jgi:hypothetical protein
LQLQLGRPATLFVPPDKVRVYALETLAKPL